MNYIIGLSIITASILSAGTVFINPLSISDRSIDNGGPTMSALQSYQDGVGAILLDPLNSTLSTDNSAMNTLVFLYGISAQTNNSTIVNEVLSNTVSPPLADIKLANQLLVQTAATAHINGTLCDDGNPTTHSETWLNDVCQGGISNVYLNGSTCNDGNPATTGETWLNDICQGGGNINVYANGTPCNDGNSGTTGETWLNDICQGGIIQSYTAGNTCATGFSGAYSSFIDCRSGAITSVDKFSGLTSVNGYLYLNGNSSLTNVNGLSNLTSVNGTLSFSSSPSLTNLDGLLNLTSINGTLDLTNNPSLTNVNGISNLTSVNGILWLTVNANLTDISGIKNLTYVKFAVNFDNKNYIVKLPAISYLCQNYSSKIIINGSLATSTTKSLVCNP